MHIDVSAFNIQLPGPTRNSSRPMPSTPPPRSAAF